MKKIKKLLLLLTAIIGCSFTACAGDDFFTPLPQGVLNDNQIENKEEVYIDDVDNKTELNDTNSEEVFDKSEDVLENENNDNLNNDLEEDKEEVEVPNEKEEEPEVSEDLEEKDESVLEDEKVNEDENLNNSEPTEKPNTEDELDKEEENESSNESVDDELINNPEEEPNEEGENTSNEEDTSNEEEEVIPPTEETPNENETETEEVPEDLEVEKDENDSTTNDTNQEDITPPIEQEEGTKEETEDSIENDTVELIISEALTFTQGVHTIENLLIICDDDDRAAIYAEGVGTVVIIESGVYYGGRNGSSAPAVYARDGAKIIINGGSFYTGEGNATIYAKNYSYIEINNGSFMALAPWENNYYVLNLADNTNSMIVVKGGIFREFDPSNNKSENPAVNFLAYGYKVVPVVKENGDIWYSVIVDEKITQ